METAYAQALWKMVAGGKDHKSAVHALKETLQKRGRLILFPRIAKAFARIAARESARGGLVLTVAHKKDEHHSLSAARKALGHDAGDIIVAVDDSLIGGWRLEGAGVLIDASHKKYLLNIYQAATKE